MRKRVFLVASLLLLMILAAAQTDTVSASEYKYKALWSGVSSSPSGRYSGIGQELKKMGVEVLRVNDAVVLTEELLEDHDLCVLACRQEILSLGEQDVIVRYVQKGGSLLVISSAYKGQPGIINPVVNNFGIMVTGTRSGSTKMTHFAHPATTERRPIKSCELGYPLLIFVSSGAEIIGGRDFAGAPASMECYLSLGAKCGCGRVIAAADEEFWQSYG